MIYINNIDFQFFLLLLIFVVSTLYIIKFIYNTSEYFDSKINNATRTQCGNICTKILECDGFAIDNNNTCYISKTPILGKPTNSVFMSDYNKNYIRCNKFNQITVSPDTSTLEYKKNATFICTPNEIENTHEKILYYQNDKEQVLNKIDDLVNVNFVPYHIDNIEFGKTIDLDKFPNLAKNPTAENSIFIMEKHNDEYLGDYLYPHKCVANIKEQDCLKHCLKESTCIGTEYDPIYLIKNDIYTGLCCPKTKIDKIIPRTKENEFGNFYLKQNIYKDSLQLSDMIIKIK
jgi:hypothetical protein